MVDSLKFCQKSKSLEIFAYVIMSSHIHLLCRRKERLLSELLRDFKSYTAKAILNAIFANPTESRKDWLKVCFEYHARFQSQNAERMFWQKTNHPIEIFSAAVFRQKMEYIHNNPVASGLVTDPAYYYYSSANPISPLRTDEW